MRIKLDEPTNWDTPLFPVVIAAQAARIEVGTLRKWIVRYGGLWEPKGEVAAPGGEQAPEIGLAHKLTFRTVLHLAAAARLTGKGAKVQDAYAAAMRWTHTGSGQGGFVASDEEAKDLPFQGRAPAGLFPAPDYTLLVHDSGSVAKVVRVPMGAGGTLSIIPGELFAGRAPTIVNLNDVDAQARAVCAEFLSGQPVAEAA